MLNCRKECLAKSGSTQISCGSGGDSALNLKKTHIRVESAIVEKNNSGNRTTMKKTLTAAVALSAIAGLALATTIATDPAGYVDQSASGLVCNPFNSFTGSAPTLGDIDGSLLGNGEYIALVSSKGVMTKLYWHDNGWYNAQSGGVSYNDTPLARGDAIQFGGAAGEGKALVISGLLVNEAVTAKAANNAGYTLFGNASPVDKDLYAFAISGGSYDPAKDYVVCGGVKYVYNNGKWIVKDTGIEVAENTVTVAAGQGLFLFCKNRPRGWSAPSITIPGTY